MSECNHDCSHCSQNCSSREYNKEDFLYNTNENSNIKKIIGVVSGKGGVGKSLTTSLLACALNKKGYKVGILDADITGPSIPTCFGITEQLMGDGKYIIPAVSKDGIKIISTNLALEDAGTPVLWRGPIIAGMIKQFYGETNWGDIDYLLVDLPPGTGDVPLTVFQSLPLDGVVIVSTPQQLVGVIVEKAIRMANMMEVKIHGLIENMSYVKCDQCGNEIKLFGPGHCEELSQQYGIDTLAKLPLDPKMAQMIDEGTIENYDIGSLLDKAIEAIK